MRHAVLLPGALAILAASLAPCQTLLPTPEGDAKESHHLLGIIPNYRTSPGMTDYYPLTAGQKFRVAARDSWDGGTFALAAMFAGVGQLTNSNRAFGQGAAGYARYFGAAYDDSVIGNYLTEAVFPTLLHQDPRYFRRGVGRGWSRAKYAMSQTFVTRSDSGSVQPNYSEWLGNSASVALSTAYYADNRTARDAVSKLGFQIGMDMAGNVLKEFSPEVQKLFWRKHGRAKDSSEP